MPHIGPNKHRRANTKQLFILYFPTRQLAAQHRGDVIEQPEAGGQQAEGLAPGAGRAVQHRGEVALEEVGLLVPATRDDGPHECPCRGPDDAGAGEGLQRPAVAQRLRDELHAWRARHAREGLQTGTSEDAQEILDALGYGGD